MDEKNLKGTEDVLEELEASAEVVAESTADTADVVECAGKSKKQRTKRDRKRLTTVLAAVVVVLAIATGGLLKWHETPGFCAAFCHNMDEFLATYSEDQGVQGTDKYGNPVSNTDAMMATLHRDNDTTALPEIRCMDCHHPVLAEQATEGIEMVTGKYYDPLYERVGGDLTHWWKEDSTRFCANEDCHAYLLGEDGLVNRDKLEQVTSKMEFNPHDTHHTGMQMECTACHKGHRASVMNCTSCHEHEDVAIPDGWLTAQESKELMARIF